MDRASQKMPAGALVGAVLLTMGAALPHSAAGASMTADGAGLLASSLGCGPAETLVGAGASGLLARVRAEATGTSWRGASRLRGGAPKARPAERLGSRKPARPSASAPRPANKTPQTDSGSRPAVLRSFYTCNAASPPNLAEGTGWRLVGPLRRS